MADTKISALTEISSADPATGDGAYESPPDIDFDETTTTVAGCQFMASLVASPLWCCVEAT